MLCSLQPAQNGRVLTLFDRSAGLEPPICTLGARKPEMHAFGGGGEHTKPSTSTLLLACLAPSLVRGPALTLPLLCRCSGGIVSISPRSGAQDSGRARCFSHSHRFVTIARYTLASLLISSRLFLVVQVAGALVRARAATADVPRPRPQPGGMFGGGFCSPHARARACDRSRSASCAPAACRAAAATPRRRGAGPARRAAPPHARCITSQHVDMCGMWCMMDRPVCCGSALCVSSQRAAGAAR